MIKEAIATASTRDEAIEKAKAALNAPIDAEVKFEILQEPQKKILGFIGGKDAKVRAYYEAEDKKSDIVPSLKENVEVEKKETAAPVKADEVSVTPEEDAAIRNYLETIIKGMGIEDVQLSSKEESDEIIYEITTEENYGAIIGHHGETLDSVQYLVRLFANKNISGNKKVSVNIGDYREKRAENLKELAARSASQVLKYGRSAKLDPMNPYERRIIHTAIQGIEGVTSHSVGYDAERRVVITLEEGVQPTHGDRRRGYNKGGRNSGYKGGRGRRDNTYKPAVSAERAPKSDFAGSRYGKIEVKKTVQSEEE